MKTTHFADTPEFDGAKTASAAAGLRLADGVLIRLGHPNVFFSALCVLGIAALTTILLQIPRGLGAHDESWYLMVVRDHVSENGGAWNMLLGFLPDDLVLWRSLSLLIRLASCPLLCYGFLSLSGTSVRPGFWIPISLLSILALDPTPVYVASYYNLNLLLFSMAFALAAAVKNARHPVGSAVLAFLSGLFTAFIGPVLPTNLPGCGLIVLAVLLFNGGSRRLRTCLLFFAGAIIGISVFFLFCETPADYLAMVRDVAAKSRNASNIHGVKALLAWISQGGSYICFRILLPAVSLAVAVALRPRRRHFASVAGAAVFAGCVFANMPRFSAILQGFSPTVPTELPWMFAAFLAAWLAASKRLSGAGLLVATLAIPVALSFGTAVSLWRRCLPYVWPLVVANFFAADMRMTVFERRRLKGALLLLVGCSFLLSYRMHFASWILLEHDFFSRKVLDERSGLRIDPLFYDNVTTLRDLGLEGASIQPCSLRDWRYVYALNGHPLSREFECHIVNLPGELAKSGKETVYFLAPPKAEEKMESLIAKCPEWRFEIVSRLPDVDFPRTVYKARKAGAPQ